MLTYSLRLTIVTAVGGLLAATAGPVAAQDVPSRQAPAAGDSARPRMEVTRQPPAHTEVVLSTRPMPHVARVAEVRDGGRYIRLDDGTVWEVALEDRVRSDGWQPGDAVRLRSLPAPTRRSYDLRLEKVSSEGTEPLRVAVRRVE